MIRHKHTVYHLEHPPNRPECFDLDVGMPDNPHTTPREQCYQLQVGHELGRIACTSGVFGIVVHSGRTLSDAAKVRLRMSAVL